MVVVPYFSNNQGMASPKCSRLHVGTHRARMDGTRIHFIVKYQYKASFAVDPKSFVDLGEDIGWL